MLATLGNVRAVHRPDLPVVGRHHQLQKLQGLARERQTAGKPTGVGARGQAAVAAQIAEVAAALHSWHQLHQMRHEFLWMLATRQ